MISETIWVVKLILNSNSNFSCHLSLSSSNTVKVQLSEKFQLWLQSTQISHFNYEYDFQL